MPAKEKTVQGGIIRVENGVPSVQVDEAVLFPFDDFSIPFVRDLRLGLVPGHKQKAFTGQRLPHEPKHPGKPVVRLGKPGEPDCRQICYYGSVIRIDGEFRMWYLGRGDLPRGREICYAVSKDGINWEKPALGLVEYGGSTQNNIVKGPIEPSFDISAIVVLYEPEDPNPDRHFKMVFESGKYNNCLAVAFSPDGLHWKELPKNPVGGGLEMSGLIKFNGCYYVNGQGGGGVLNRRGRALVTFASYDFENWTKAGNLGFQRGNVRTLGVFSEECHLGAALWNRGNVIIGFYGMWHGHPSNDRRFLWMDIGMVVSNDAIHFREPIPDFKIIPCYEECDDAAPALQQGQGFENIGDRTLVWYGEWPWAYGISDRADRKGLGAAKGGEVRVATWARDRLGYFSASGRTAHLISCPLRLDYPGAKVFVNADGLSEHSYLRVEICDYKFHLLPGYSGEDCIPLKESGFRQPVTWRNKETLEKFDHPIRVKVSWGGIRPEDARLYAVYVTADRDFSESR